MRFILLVGLYFDDVLRLLLLLVSCLSERATESSIDESDCYRCNLCIHYGSCASHHNNGITRKINITLNFRCHMYEIFLERDLTCSWTLPCHKLSHFHGPSTSSSVMYFMVGPLLMKPSLN